MSNSSNDIIVAIERVIQDKEFNNPCYGEAPNNLEELESETSNFRLDECTKLQANINDYTNASTGDELVSKPRTSVRIDDVEALHEEIVLENEQDFERVITTKSSISEQTQEIQNIEKNSEVTPKPNTIDQNSEVTHKPETTDQNSEVTHEPNTIKQNSEVTPEPNTIKQNSESTPEPNTTEQNSEVTPKPETKEQNSEVTPEPETTDQNSEVTPEPNTTKQNSEVTPEPDTTEQNSEVTPEPNTTKQNYEVTPEPSTTEQNSEVTPEPNITKLNADTNPEPSDNIKLSSQEAERSENPNSDGLKGQVSAHNCGKTPFSFSDFVAQPHRPDSPNLSIGESKLDFSGRITFSYYFTFKKGKGG